MTKTQSGVLLSVHGHEPSSTAKTIRSRTVTKQVSPASECSTVSSIDEENEDDGQKTIQVHGNDDERQEQEDAAADWFVVNKNTWGNRRFLVSKFHYRYVAPPLVVLLTVLTGSTFVSVLGQESRAVLNWSVYSLLGIGFLVLFALLLYFYPSDFHDSLYVHLELRLLCIVGLVTLITSIGLLGVAVAVKMSANLVDFIYNSIMMLFIIAFTFIESRLIVTLFDWQAKEEKKRKKASALLAKFQAAQASGMPGGGEEEKSGCAGNERCCCCVASWDERIAVLLVHHVAPSKQVVTIDSVLLRDASQLPDVSLKEALADEHGFRAFVSHLFSEYSFESILCGKSVSLVLEANALPK